jgi:AcrR family transcriptional regulator
MPVAPTDRRQCTKPMARPKDQTARRAHLMTAALDAIRSRGVASLRIRDVAEAAGVSTGTVHYYFDDLDQLLFEVHTAACDRFYADRLAAISELDDARDKLATMIASGLPTSRDDAMAIAMYEIDVYKLGNPVHALLHRGLYDRQVALYHGILELGRSQGHFTFDVPVVDVAQNMVALEDAYGLHVISGNQSLPVDRCAELIVGYARTVTGCAELTASPV